MKNQILDAVCILPRIELLCRYLEEELDLLEMNQRGISNEEISLIYQRIRQLSFMTEEISTKVFTDVTNILESRD